MMTALGYIGNLFLSWLGLFAAPAKDLNMLWLIIPIYLGWIFAEFYQEKKGTDFGNAVSNGVVPLWAGMDWGKTTISMLTAGTISLDFMFAIKMIIVFAMIAYAIIIFVIGIKVMKIAKYIARIREVTYFVIVFTPIVYGVVAPTRDIVIAILLFFPVFYGLIELLDRVLPTPKTYDQEFGPSEGSSIPSEFGGDFGNMETESIPDVGEAAPRTTQPAQYPAYPQQQYPQQYPRGGYR